MPVTKDSPLVEIKKLRKKIENNKETKPSEHQKNRENRPAPSVIPATEFNKTIERARDVAKSLVAAKKKLKKNQELPGSYKRGAKELSGLMSNIVMTIKNIATVVVDANVRAGLIANADNLPEVARKAGIAITRGLSGAHRSIKKLNEDISRELSKSARGVEPKTLLGYLPEIKSIYNIANSSRLEAEKLYKQWGPRLNPAKHNKNETGGVIPKFVVRKSIVKTGEPKGEAQTRNAKKIQESLNLGGADFPDPYTIMWKYYGGKISGRTVHLDSDVKAIVRHAIQYAAKSNPVPKQHSILELYNNGDLVVNDKFESELFNTNFRNVIGNTLRKMERDPECKKFVFSLVQGADDDKWVASINHLKKTDARGGSLVDNARKAYLEASRQWFITYMPVLRNPNKK